MEYTENGKKGINVCYVADHKYAPIAAASIASLIGNNDMLFFRIHFIDTGLMQDDIIKLTKYVNTSGNDIKFYYGNSTIEYYKRMGTPAFTGNYSTYARMGIHKLIDTSVQRILYLDCDTLVLGDISGLLDIEIKGAYRAVEDIIPPSYCKKIGLGKEWAYLNAGILLIRLEKWAEMFSDGKIRCLCDEIADSKYPDQDMINLAGYRLLSSSDVLLEPTYDVLMPWIEWGYNGLRNLYPYINKQKTDKNLTIDAIKHPTIVHLVDGITGRPWQKDNENKYQNLWNDYLSDTQFQNPLVESHRNIRNRLLKLMYRYLGSNLTSALYRIFIELRNIWGEVKR